MDATVAESEVKPQKARKKGGAAPPKQLNQDRVALGQAAWERLKANNGKSWEDWLLIGEALLVGRQEAEKKAGKRVGAKYNQLFHNWKEAHRFGEIDKSDCAKLLLIMENLDEIEEWRATLDEGQRVSWCAPSTVWRVSRCKDRGLPRLRSDDNKPSGNGSCNTQHDEDDEREKEIRWQRNIIWRARKSLSDAEIHDDWLVEPPEPGTIVAVWQAAERWKMLAEYLESIYSASPEELARQKETHLLKAAEARAS